MGFGFVRSHLALLDPLAAKLIAAVYESL
jgi:hypothetical protein